MTADFQYQDMLPTGEHHETPYRLLTTDGVRTVEAPARHLLEVDPAVLNLLTTEAKSNTAHS